MQRRRQPVAVQGSPVVVAVLRWRVVVLLRVVVRPVWRLHRLRVLRPRSSLQRARFGPRAKRWRRRRRRQQVQCRAPQVVVLQHRRRRGPGVM